MAVVSSETPTDPEQCSFYMVGKHRFCGLRKMPGLMFCSSHAPNDTAGTVPCPIDPSQLDRPTQKFLTRFLVLFLYALLQSTAKNVLGLKRMLHRQPAINWILMLALTERTLKYTKPPQ